MHKFLNDNDNRSHFMHRPSPVVVSPVTGACRPFDRYIVPPGGVAVNTFSKKKNYNQVRPPPGPGGGANLAGPRYKVNS